MSLPGWPFYGFEQIWSVVCWEGSTTEVAIFSVKSISRNFPSQNIWYIRNRIRIFLWYKVRIQALTKGVCIWYLPHPPSLQLTKEHFRLKSRRQICTAFVSFLSVSFGTVVYLNALPMAWQLPFSACLSRSGCWPELLCLPSYLPGASNLQAWVFFRCITYIIT